jgi:hypothetical protein
MPLEVIFLQRYEPDSSLICLSFNNQNQFLSKDWVSFAVFFSNGKCSKIQRTDDPNFKSLFKMLTENQKKSPEEK